MKVDAAEEVNGKRNGVYGKEREKKKKTKKRQKEYN